MAVFPGRYGRIGEIPHGRIWPDWGNTTWADMAGLGSIGLINMFSAFCPKTHLLFMLFCLSIRPLARSTNVAIYIF